MAKTKAATDTQMLSFVSAEVAAASAETAGAIAPPHLGAGISWLELVDTAFPTQSGPRDLRGVYFFKRR